MLSTFKYTVITLFRTPSILVWALAFPIILSSCFVLMFGNVNEHSELDPINVLVVEDDDYNAAIAEPFRAYLEAISGDDGPLSVRGVDTRAEAEVALVGGADAKPTDVDTDAAVTTVAVDDVPDAKDRNTAAAEDPIAVIWVDEDGMPHVVVPNKADPAGYTTICRQLVVELADLFKSRASMVQSMLAEKPALIQDPAFFESAFSVSDVTERVQLTANTPSETVRYYYALLGMAALMGAQAALVSVLRLLPNMEPLGARRSISGLSRSKSLAGTMLGSWLVTFVCLLVAFAYMLFVCKVDFGGRDVMAVLALAVSALTATALGAAIAVVPKVNNSSKGGILTAITCFAALFAGLYGEPTMRLADDIAAAFPASELVNPAVQIAQSFYSLMYYDSLAPCLMHLGVLMVMVVILFALSASSLRRVRYASL